MTVAALGEQMSSTEVAEWQAFLAIEQEERERRRKQKPSAESED